MNAYTFDGHSAVCPICQRAGGIKSSKIFSGLLTCQHCQERFVVSWSGHYVRDPFTLRQLAVGRMLRRQSRPIARIARDFSRARTLPVLAALGSAVFLGLGLATFKDPMTQQPAPPHPIEGTPEAVDTTERLPRSKFYPHSLTDQ